MKGQIVTYLGDKAILAYFVRASFPATGAVLRKIKAALKMPSAAIAEQ